jgi:hypothetical protein
MRNTETNTIEEEDGAERQTRVLGVNCPKLMRAITIATIAHHPDIAIVGGVADDGAILGPGEETRPDFFFIPLNGWEKPTPVCDAIRHLHPTVNIEASREAILSVIPRTATRTREMS